VPGRVSLPGHGDVYYENLLGQGLEIEKEVGGDRREGLVVGRLAAIIAVTLRGKHKPSYSPTWTMATTSSSSTRAKALLTGDKLKKKVYYHHTGYIGGIKERTAARSARQISRADRRRRRWNACCRAGRS